ncbi:TPA: hypothetical protein JBB31_14660 [Legionella pneumophila subsp. pneumophila]|nr:hypothetical protein [Legionella pneumophila subsp. pneumophila]
METKTVELIATFILGISAKPIHEWINHIVNRKHLQIEKKQKGIKQAFLLSQKLKKIPGSLKQAISSAVFIKNGVQQPDSVKSESQFDMDTHIDQLKLILYFDTNCPEHIRKELDELKEHMFYGLRILSREFNKPLVPTSLPEDEFIKKYKDPIVAASAWSSLTEQKTEKLIKEIECHLHNESSKIQNSYLYARIKSFYHNKIKPTWNKMQEYLSNRSS